MGTWIYFTQGVKTLFLLNDSANYCSSHIITGVYVDDRKQNG